MFKNKTVGTGKRLTGMPRYIELLERDWKKFLLGNVITFLAFLPLFSGVTLALLSSSLFVLIPSCIIGGAIAGPAFSCMHDVTLRSLRDASTDLWEDYKRAWKQNWRQSIVPGIVLSLLLGFYTFTVLLFFFATTRPALTIVVALILGLLIITMAVTIYWPMLVLFDEPLGQRIQNCILFLIRYFWKMVGCALLQIAYWGVIALFMPYSIILLPLLGFWFILFTTNFILYPTWEAIFHIDEQIAKNFPEQAPYYEDDEAWLKRKQQER